MSHRHGSGGYKSGRTVTDLKEIPNIGPIQCPYAWLRSTLLSDMERGYILGALSSIHRKTPWLWVVGLHGVNLIY